MNHFKNIYGYEDVRGELAQIVSCLSGFEEFQSLGVHLPSGLLLAGSPGLGKTLMAQSLIQASGLPSFVCRKTERGNSMLKSIRKTFDAAAESTPSIVLLDDIDKFSNCDYDLVDTEEYVVVQSCIDAHKGEGIFVVATANDVNKLPQSLLRPGRFDRIIELDPPHGSDILAIVSHYLDDVPLAPGVDPQTIADILDGSSCALIETTVNEASLLAGFEGANCTSLVHFVRAYARMEGGGSLAELPGSLSLQDAWATERAQVAFHEAGHVVVEETLHPGAASLAAIVQRQGRLGGLAKRRHITPTGTYQETKAEVLVTLAGGLAVEHKYGIPCLGCKSDNNAASGAIKSMLGDTSLLGSYFNGLSRWPGSESFDDACERACAVIMEQLRWEAREILARHWHLVERIADLLYRDGYVLPSDIADGVQALEQTQSMN